MSKITWPNRTDLKAVIGATYEWAAAIANEVKDSINALYSDNKTWYVSKGGDNSNIGSTKAEPFQTIAAALAVMGPGDVIELLGTASAEFNENLTIGSGLTSITIRGQIPNTEGGPSITIDGTWDLNGNNVYFNNLTVAVTWDRSTDFNLTCTDCVITSPFTDSHAILALNNCVWTVHATSNIESLIVNNSTLLASTTVQIATFLRSHGTDIAGSVTAGIVSFSSCQLKNSSITGDLTVTGDLNKENSTVGGAEAVSGTTTDNTQDDQTKLSKLDASDQSVVSNVFLSDELGVSSGIAVGSSYSEIETPPADGTIIEGDVGVGTTDLSIPLIGGNNKMVVKVVANSKDILRIADVSRGVLITASNGSKARAMIASTLNVAGHDLTFGFMDAGFSPSEAMRIEPLTFNMGIKITDPKTQLDVGGAITSHELSSDPADPIEGANVTWQSDGTGSGDDGDIMMKITAGAVTKTTTLIDFSAI